MEGYRGLRFESFTEGDVEALTDIMKRAFDEDTRIHLGREVGGPPGYDNGDFMREWYLHEDVTAYTISKGGRPIGAIALWIHDNHENYLGNVFIDPKEQGQGLGAAMWEFVERKYPQTRIWRTDTAGFSRRNHHFYVNKCGFRVVRIEDAKNADGGSYILEKVM